MWYGYPQPSDEDRKILEDANRLLQHFNFRVVPPSIVMWRDSFRIGKSRGSVASDIVLPWGTFLVIPERLKGRLEPEEWKPLVASSLIYFNSPIHRRIVRQVLSRVVLPLLFFVGLVDYAVFQLRPQLFWQVLTLTLLVAVIVGKALSTPITSKAWMAADRQAAAIVGKEAMLNTLAKIDRMGLKDVEKVKRKGLGNIFRGRPSITRRIHNLQEWFPSTAD